MTEKPLHVRVAEALGAQIRLKDGWWERLDGSWTAAIPRYDTAWEATGPLIERFCLALRPPAEPPQIGSSLWEAYWWGADEEETTAGSSDGPLIAVCLLILMLGEAGKLP